MTSARQITQSLGPDLPATEEQLFELNSFPLLDINHGMQMTSSQPLLLGLLKELINTSYQGDIPLLQKAYARQDWNQIEKIAHKIKGGLLYLGTIRMRYACQYLERYLKAGHSRVLHPLYEQLIQISEETKAAIELFLREYER